MLRSSHRFGAAGATRVALIALVTAVVAALGVLTRPASGAAAHASVVAAPARGLGVGIVDDPLLVQSSPSVQNYWFGQAQSLGSHWVRIGVLWAGVAPYTLPAHFNGSDPGSRYYNFSQVDRAVRAAAAHGQTVLLNIHQAPNWAEAPGVPSYAGPGSWEPSAPALRDFAHALAVRYSGHYHHLPRVRYYQAWNEPNLLNYLSPQWGRDAHGALVAYSPILYRALLNAVYSGVKGVSRSNFVLAAGTAPFGDPPGQNRMQPKTFLEGLFCLTASLARTSCPGGIAHLDGLDHHVYSPPWYGAALADDIGIPDLGRIWSVLSAARRAHTVAPDTAKQLWITEAGANANPESAANLALQAHYLSEDLYAFWRAGVTNVFWFSIQDPGVAAGSFFATGGLYTAPGAAKPDAVAYRFPFVAVPDGHNRLALWGKAPRGGVVAVQRLGRRGWRTVMRLRTNTSRVFYGHIHSTGTPQYRAVIGGAASPPWTAGT